MFAIFEMTQQSYKNTWSKNTEDVTSSSNKNGNLPSDLLALEIDVFPCSAYSRRMAYIIGHMTYALHATPLLH